MLDRPKVRLYVPQDIIAGQAVILPQDQSHYLVNVMRMAEGAMVEIFNGHGPGFAAEISRAHKKATELTPKGQSVPFTPLADLWLLFAPIKKARTDFIVEKATELGAARIVPVFTEYTNSERLRVDRLTAHAIEAAEQCGGTAVPEIAEPTKLAALLSDWPTDRHLLFADEGTAGAALTLLPKGPAAILIGPEGGFSDAERNQISSIANSHILQLGNRILRADTAAVAAITRWQAEVGDWA